MGVMDRDTASWPDWYLAGALRCVAEVIRRQDVDDDQLVRIWHAYVDSAARTEREPAAARV
jgi:hypothetical protein